MWYIFPQLKHLGRSSIAEFYGISGLAEAKEYLAHPVLGARLVEISKALYVHYDKSAVEIFVVTDAKKLRSCMTLFNRAALNEPVFSDVLKLFLMDKKID